MLRHIGRGTGYLGGVHSGNPGLQYSLRLNLLPDGQAADSHGFRFHGLWGDEEEHCVSNPSMIPAYRQL